MASTGAVILGFLQGVAVLKRIKAAVEKWRTTGKIDIESVRKEMEP